MAVNYDIITQLYNLKRCVIPSGGGDTKKHPIVSWTEFQSRLSTQDEINKWLKIKPQLWGMVTGEISGIVVFDADTPETVQLFHDTGLKPHVKTRKGEHYYFRWPGHLMKNSAGKLMKGLDFRGDGGFVNWAGNNYKHFGWKEDGTEDYEGGIYEMLIIPTDESLYNLTQLPLPVKEALIAQGKEAIQASPTIGETIGDGNRNQTLASLAGTLRHRGMTQDIIEITLLETNRAKCKPPLPESEVLDIAKSISRYAPGSEHKHSYPYTDMGNAERLYAKSGDTFRWVSERQRFIIWNGHVWDYDTLDNTQLLKLTKLTIRDIANEPDGPGENGYKDKLKHALSSESGKRQRETINLVKSEGNITISINELDKDFYLFNCRNTTIDLRTGKTRKQNKDDLITITAPVDFDPTATCPKWIQFLNLIQNNNQDMITYLQKICGYAMTGDVKTKIVPFCHGMGGNGKSTFWGVIRDILGPYSYQVDPDVFLSNGRDYRDSGQREELANLYGKRLVTCTEIPDGKELTTSLLKAVSGSEEIHGDRKHEHVITYKPTFKVILAGNNEPEVKDTTDGTWKRLKKIPFNVTIPNQKEGFNSLYSDELPGILNWMLEGCLLWQSEGLKDPEPVVNATAEYRKEQDVVSQVIDDLCIRNESEELTKKQFKASYQKWCTEMSVKPLGDKALRQRLLALKITDGFNSAGTARVWKGIRLKELSDSLTATDVKNPVDPTRDRNSESYRGNGVSSCQTASFSDRTEKNQSGESGETSQDVCQHACNLCDKFQKVNGKYQCTIAEASQ